MASSRTKRLLSHLRGLLHPPARRLIYRGGLFMSGDEGFPSTLATLSYLKAWGFRPRTVVDVGAYEGEWTRMVKGLFPEARVLMVEPQEQKQEGLRRLAEAHAPDLHLAPALLGPRDGEVVEFVEMESGSSVFEEQSPSWRGKRRVRKERRRSRSRPSSPPRAAGTPSTS
jgi:hypothetical protein